MLLGSALANIGACARVVMFHIVAAPEVSSVGDVPAGGPGFSPYWLTVVVKFRFAEIHVLDALFPCKYEYGYQVPFGDW